MRIFSIVIDFLIENPVSPLEQFQSPDGRKLGILIESLELSKLESRSEEENIYSKLT